MKSFVMERILVRCPARHDVNFLSTLVSCWNLVAHTQADASSSQAWTSGKYGVDLKYIMHEGTCKKNLYCEEVVFVEGQGVSIISEWKTHILYRFVIHRVNDFKAFYFSKFWWLWKPQILFIILRSKFVSIHSIVDWASFGINVYQYVFVFCFFQL